MFDRVHKKSALSDFPDSALYNKGNLLVALYVFSCQPCSYSSRKQNYLFSRNFTIPIVGYFQVYACFIVRKELVLEYRLPTNFAVNVSVLIREFGTRHDAFLSKIR